MISFRTRSDAVTSVVIIIALLTMVASVVLFYMPKPKVSGSRSRDEAKLKDRVAQMEKEEAEHKALIASLVWTLPIEEIGPKALESITNYAQKDKVKLISFRPQKPVEVNSLNQLPFLISLEGPYPAVMKFVKDLETPSLRLATTLVQISSSDPDSDKTSATVGVAAYKQLETKKTTVTEKSNATKKEN